MSDRTTARPPTSRSVGRIGVWSAELRTGDPRVLAEEVGRLEELGYGAVWLPGRTDDVFDVAATYLRETSTVAVATGIASIWSYDPVVAGRHAAALAEAHGDRFVLGLGVSHAPLVNVGGATPYRHPLAHMEAYLDALDAGPGSEVARILAALGPRMLDLARRRATGSHPYLVPPEHTAAARARLDPGSLLAPCQTVTLLDGDAAHRVLRRELATYLGFPNYVENWRRFGATDGDLADGGSERLLSMLFAWGGVEAVAERVAAHLAAGADHVCLKVLVEDGTGLPTAEWRRLAGALTAP